MTPEVAAAALAILWEAIGKDIANKFKDVFSLPWTKFDYRRAAIDYASQIEGMCSTLKILGKSEPVSLDGIFTHVYILDQVTSRIRYDLNELRQYYSDEIEQRYSIEAMNAQMPVDFNLGLTNRVTRIHGIELVRRGSNLFILGKPGSGKTTFLKYIARQCIQGHIEKTPIFVSLHEFANQSTENLLEYIVSQFRSCDFPDPESFVKNLLESGKAIVLFDGLDEVNEEDNKRGNLSKVLNKFVLTYRQCQCLITCRIAASEFGFQTMQDVEVADFTDEQIEEYARKWFGINKRKYAIFIDELNRPGNSRIRELCTIPLLLSMICLSFSESMRFPTKRVELYYDALSALLRRWDTEHRAIRRDEIYAGLSFVRKLKLFSHIAAPTFDNVEYLIPERQLSRRIAIYLENLPGSPSADEIDGNEILKQIQSQHSILVERAQGIYSFSHLTFHEFFTAQYIVENEAAGTIKTLCQKHLTNERWTEVFLMTASLLDDADRFLMEMRKGLDKLILPYPNLVNLLTWAHEKSSNMDVPSNKISSSRLGYVFLLSLSQPSLVIDSRLAETMDSQLDSLLERMQVLRVVLDFDHDFEKLVSLLPRPAIQLISDIISSFGLDLGLDFGLIYAIKIGALLCKLVERTNTPKTISSEFVLFLSELREVALKGNEPKIASQLSSFVALFNSEPIPNLHDIIAKLKIQAHRIRAINFDWDIDDIEWETLNIYLKANALFIECLKNAYVSNRQQILNSILTPPTNSELTA